MAHLLQQQGSSSSNSSLATMTVGAGQQGTTAVGGGLAGAGAVTAVSSHLQRGLNTTTVDTINGPTSTTHIAGGPPYSGRGPPPSSVNRPSRRDQLSRGYSGDHTAYDHGPRLTGPGGGPGAYSHSQPASVRGSPAASASRRGAAVGRGGVGISRSYNTSPSGRTYFSTLLAQQPHFYKVQRS